MKKFKFLSIIFMAILIFPMVANAQRYYPEGTDLSINIDDTTWYVFTRDNLLNNPELDELGITYDYLYNFMHNNYVYLDSILFYNDSNDYIELLIRKKNIDKIINLSNYSNKEVMEFAKKLADKQNSKFYDIYETDYKYVYLKYQDKGYYLVEYYTIVNKEGYTITAQKSSPFTDDEIIEVENLINRIDFDIDTSLKEPSKSFNNIWKHAIISGITGAIISGVVALISKKNKKKRMMTKKE